MFLDSTQIETLEKHIKYILNAASGGWSAAIDNLARVQEAITESRRNATLEVLRAISRNPQHGFFGQLATVTTITNGAFLPDHEGAHGVPEIQAFTDAPFLQAQPADADDIDSWRADGNGMFTRVLGMETAHDAADFMGMPSPVAGFYDITNKQIRFTGKICRIPLIIINDTTLENKIPFSLKDVILKLAPLYNLREADNLAGIAGQLVSAGRSDLMAIEKGAVSVSPVSDIIKLQENE